VVRRYWWRSVKLGLILNFFLHGPRSTFEFATNITYGEKMNLCKNLQMVSLPQKPFQAEKK